MAMVHELRQLAGVPCAAGSRAVPVMECPPTLARGVSLTSAVSMSAPLDTVGSHRYLGVSVMGQVSIAVSRLAEEDSREAQNARAVKWLLAQRGGAVVVVTPRRDFESVSIKRLTAQPGVHHHVWRGFHGGHFDGRRVLYAWPDRQRLNDLWNADADAIVVIEWGVEETAEWIEDVNPIQLLPGATIDPSPRMAATPEPLSNGVDGILEYVAGMAAGYSSGLKWNEEDMLKADMMNRPDRWASITVDQVRAKCRALGMRGADVDTIAGFLQRRKEGRRFNVRSSYRAFQFN